MRIINPNYVIVCSANFQILLNLMFFIICLGRIVRDSVPVQGNLYDCGVHVLIWLLQWSPRARLTYTDADVAMFRSNLMWWLSSHPQNIVKDKALALLGDYVQPKRARIV